MPLTRAAVEGVLVSRTQALLDAATMSLVTDGTNADLNNPLADTLMRLGVVPADLALVADSDLATLPGDPTTQRMFLDYAELRLKRDILARLTVLVTQSAQTSYVNLSDMAKALSLDIREMQSRLDLMYADGRVIVTTTTWPHAWGPPMPAHWGWPWEGWR